METVLSVLTVVLGLDYTLLIQLSLFVVTYLFLSQFLFKPYVRAYEERAKSTSVLDEDFAQLEKQTEELELEYQSFARELNNKIKQIYERDHEKAVFESQEIVRVAQERTKEKIVAAKLEIKDQQKSARKALAVELPGVVKVISEKMLN